jgi:exonuclease III
MIATYLINSTNNFPISLVEYMNMVQDSIVCLQVDKYSTDSASHALANGNHYDKMKWSDILDYY